MNKEEGLLYSRSNATGYTITQDIKVIKYTFVDFYTKLLGTAHTTPHLGPQRVQQLVTRRLTPDQSLSMVSNITDLEIQETFRSLNPNKAPGPDGYKTLSSFRKPGLLLAMKLLQLSKLSLDLGNFLERPTPLGQDFCSHKYEFTRTQRWNLLLWWLKFWFILLLGSAESNGCVRDFWWSRFEGLIQIRLELILYTGPAARSVWIDDVGYVSLTQIRLERFVQVFLFPLFRWTRNT